MELLAGKLHMTGEGGMTAERIILKIEGPATNSHHVELSVFLEKVRHFHQMLRAGIKHHAPKDSDVTFNLVQLSHSSPATIECQPMLHGQPYIPLVQDIDAMLHAVEEGRLEQLSDDFLSAVEKLAKKEPKKIMSSEIQITGANQEELHVCRLDDEFRAKLTRTQNEGHIEINTIDGVLEEINIHSNPYTFKIYDASFASATITCQFPKELLEQVQAALGHGVFVSGECFYRPSKSIPYKIIVQKIEVLPPASDLPSFSDLRGIAPGITGGKTPEEFVRESRDLWN